MWPFRRRKPRLPLDIDRRDVTACLVRVAGAIDDAVANVVVAQLLLHRMNAAPLVTMRIGSPGGSVAAGMTIADTLALIEYDVHVRTEVPNWACGMAVVLLAAGRRGSRVVGPNACVSIERVFAGAHSMATETERHRCQREITHLLAARSGRSADQVARRIEQGLRLEGAGIVAFGLADRVEPLSPLEPRGAIS